MCILSSIKKEVVLCHHYIAQQKNAHITVINFAPKEILTSAAQQQRVPAVLVVKVSGKIQEVHPTMPAADVPISRLNVKPRIVPTMKIVCVRQMASISAARVHAAAKTRSAVRSVVNNRQI